MLQESLPVVFHRFSDGVDVLKCVAGFIKVCAAFSSSRLACLCVCDCRR